MRNLTSYGVLFLGIGVLIFALTFLHLYLTKIMPEESEDLYLQCSVTNTSTYVQVNARKEVKEVRIEVIPLNASCFIGDLKQGDSDACIFNGSSSFARAVYKERGKIRKKVNRCYYLAISMPGVD